MAEVGENYGKTGFDYYLKQVFRRVAGFFLSYPEFQFLGKIGIILIIVAVAFVILAGIFRGKMQSSTDSSTIQFIQK